MMVQLLSVHYGPIHSITDMRINGVARDAELAGREGDIGVALTEHAVDLDALGLAHRMARAARAGLAVPLWQQRVAGQLQMALDMFLANDPQGTPKLLCTVPGYGHGTAGQT